MSDSGLFNETINRGIFKDHCVMLVDNKIVYAGPIKAVETCSVASQLFRKAEG